MCWFSESRNDGGVALDFSENPRTVTLQSRLSSFISISDYCIDLHGAILLCFDLDVKDVVGGSNRQKIDSIVLCLCLISLRFRSDTYDFFLGVFMRSQIALLRRPSKTQLIEGQVFGSPDCSAAGFLVRIAPRYAIMYNKFIVSTATRSRRGVSTIRRRL